MKAFVTGGTGFIGSHVIEHLLQQPNTEVYALVRNPHKLRWLQGLKVLIAEGNLDSLPSLPPDIDYVLHIAGLTKAHKTADYYTVNQQGTASLFKGLRRQGIRPRKTILLSSLAVTGPSPDGKPIEESRPPAPVTPYGWSKLGGEQEALLVKDDFPDIILRVGGVYGPRDTDFLTYFKYIRKGILPTLGSGAKLVSLCYVKDLAHAVSLSMQKDMENGEILHIADPEPYDWNQMGRLAGRILGKNPWHVRLPFFAAYLAAWVSDLISQATNSPSIFSRQKLNEMKQKAWIADTSKAQKRLGYHPQYTLEEGLRETLAWYIQHGWL